MDALNVSVLVGSHGVYPWFLPSLRYAFAIANLGMMREAFQGRKGGRERKKGDALVTGHSLQRFVFSCWHSHLEHNDTYISEVKKVHGIKV